jgi:hypothetical protein
MVRALGPFGRAESSSEVRVSAVRVSAVSTERDERDESGVRRGCMRGLL